MHIVISDDHQDCIRHLACFEKLKGHTVEIFNNSVSGTDALAERYKDAEAIVLIRERTVITRELLDRLPKLKVISQTGKMAAHVDLQACKEKGIVVMDGLSGTEKVVMRAGGFLNPGDVVRPVAANASPPAARRGA